MNDAGILLGGSAGRLVKPFSTQISARRLCWYEDVRFTHNRHCQTLNGCAEFELYGRLMQFGIDEMAAADRYVLRLGTLPLPIPRPDFANSDSDSPPNRTN